MVNIPKGYLCDHLQAQLVARCAISAPFSTLQTNADTVTDTIAGDTRPFPAAYAFGDVWVPSYAGTDFSASTSAERRSRSVDGSAERP